MILNRASLTEGLISLRFFAEIHVMLFWKYWSSIIKWIACQYIGVGGMRGAFSTIRLCFLMLFESFGITLWPHENPFVCKLARTTYRICESAAFGYFFGIWSAFKTKKSIRKVTEIGDTPLREPSNRHSVMRKCSKTSKKHKSIVVW